MKVELLAVGTELLLGDITNTNGQYLAKKMAESGFSLYYQTVVGDNKERITDALRIAYERADMVITTGGLGPTDDDITKEVCADFFNKDLISDPQTLAKIEDMYKTRHVPMPEINKKQALYIEDSVILENHYGSAIGCYLQSDNKHLIILPGPPSEMIPMYENQVLPLISSLQTETFFSNYLNIFGIGESSVNETIKDFLQQNNPTVAPYAKDYLVKLRITASGSSENVAQVAIDAVKKEIRKRLGDHFFSEGSMTLEEVVKNKLEKKSLTIAVAESCTGGLLSAKLIGLPGISNVFKEGLIAYSNSSKVRSLQIPEDVLRKHGAVSKECAMMMAKHVALNNFAQIGISTTGIAGPSGDSPEKPVGLVYIGFYIDGKEEYLELRLNGTRDRIREMTVLTALFHLQKMI